MQVLIYAIMFIAMVLAWWRSYQKEVGFMEKLAYISFIIAVSGVLFLAVQVDFIQIVPVSETVVNGVTSIEYGKETVSYFVKPMNIFYLLIMAINFIRIPYGIYLELKAVLGEQGDDKDELDPILR